MLIDIYLGTVLVSTIITLIGSYLYEKRLERDGYERKVEAAKEKTLLEELASSVICILQFLIPVFPIITSIMLIILGEEVFCNKLMEIELKDGNIYKIEEVKNKKRKKKAFIDMTREEKDVYIEKIRREVSIAQNNEQTASILELENNYKEMTREKIAYLEQLKAEILKTQNNIPQPEILTRTRRKDFNQLKD